MPSDNNFVELVPTWGTATTTTNFNFNNVATAYITSIWHIGTNEPLNKPKVVDEVEDVVFDLE